jgi:N-acyl homoserine lactone hydrolase
MIASVAVEGIGIPARSDTHGSLGWSSALALATADGVLLFDTGGPGYRAMWDAWLGRNRLSRDDVTSVYLTHSHWDHLGSAAWFPNASYVISRDEVDWARGAGRDDPYVEPFLLAGLLATGRVHDIAGDERVGPVYAIRTPGHTPGHLSYQFDAPDGSPRIFVGDALKYRSEFEGGAFGITSDPGKSDESRRALRTRWADGAALLFGHDGWLAADGTRERPRADIELMSDGAIEVREP